MYVECFERQLQIFVLIIIVGVVAPIVHGQKIYNAEIAVTLLMLNIVCNKQMQPQHLVEGRTAQQERKQ